MDILDIFLLVIQALFWTCCVYKLWGKNRFYALFCMVLFLYLFPTEISYRFYPHFYDYYWGVDCWYTYYWYISLSLLILLLVLKHSNQNCRIYNVVRYKKHSFSGFIWILIVFYSLTATYLLYSNIGMISYQALVLNGAAGNEDSTLATIDLIFGNIPGFVIFPIISMSESKWYVKTFALYNIILSFFYSVISGSRSDILALTLGIVLIWMYGRKIGLKHIVMLAVISAAFLLIAGLAFTLRGGSNDGTLAEILLMQDYSGPAYNIMAVIGKDIIDPIVVLKSQLGKALPIFGVDWLYIPIGRIAFPDVEMSASQGMGFHPFAEGYMFAGFIGFLYNGFIVGSGLAIWNRFMNTNDKRFNRYMFAIMGCLFFALVRAQSVWFFRYIFLSFIPATFLYSRLFNIKINYWGFFKNCSTINKFNP